jgi:hypothetical protein
MVIGDDPRFERFIARLLRPYVGKATRRKRTSERQEGEVAMIDLVN